MFRLAANQIANVMRSSVSSASRVSAVRALHGHDIPAEEFDKRYEDYFNRSDIDGWEVRKGMNDLLGMDLVPAPKIVEAGLKACRRVNDIALAIRWLEGVKDKCGDKTDEIFPYIMDSVRPTLAELGVPTLEELNYDKPELALKSVYDM
uniref:Cytochrome c oxidase subunit 5A, mitochondrial n=1 Tax=Glossina pallidipes TaxID=7398 RepID=A0A1A9ZCE0_GLOPL